MSKLSSFKLNWLTGFLRHLRSIESELKLLNGGERCCMSFQKNGAVSLEAFESCQGLEWEKKVIIILLTWNIKTLFLINI